MKKIILASAICLLTSACATNGAGGNMMVKLKTCLTEKGWTTIAEGTLYSNGISATARQISETCLNELSLQDMGIENQTVQTATTILNALVSAKQTEK